MREYESGVDVFVYVCIWFTHQSSRVTSVTRPGARPRQRCACVLPFRLLQELSVADGEVSETERNSGSVWRSV